MGLPALWAPDAAAMAASQCEKLLLDPGDASVAHMGGKGGVRVKWVEVTQAPAAAVPKDQLQWLNDNRIDWDGTSA